MGAMLGDDQRLWFRQIEHLTTDKVDRHRLGQRRAACATVGRIMVNERVGRLAPVQRLAQMARLPAGLLAGALSQAADSRRLLQSVTGRRLATVAAVQPETALQLGNARLLRQQQGDQRVPSTAG